MRFSLKFIKKFLDVDVGPQQLAELLTMAGMEVERIEKLKGDFAFDIEVTTNRYDWLSMVGIAREAAAVLGKELNIEYPKAEKNLIPGERKIIIKNLDDCSYYIGRTFENVKIKAAAADLSELVLNCGLGAVNDVVDITNYCMLKWGNPLHAFDNDKIKGNVYIRRAKKGESFVGIDSKQRELVPENLVIADDEKVIALAGIMGAKNTEVDHTTKNIFLEAAVFSPLAVRRSRRAVGLDTESSYRFERMVSADHLEHASSETSQLIEKKVGAKLVGLSVAGKKPKAKQEKINIKIDQLNIYLGAQFSKSAVRKVLKSLDFTVKDLAADELTILPPVDRFDIEREVDIYEEFSRVYGYDKIPAQIPFLKRCPQDGPGIKQRVDLWRQKEEIANFVALLQFKEIVSFSLEQEQEIVAAADSQPIAVVNPLRQQENAMRTSLLGGMIKSIKHNLNRGQSGLYLFEIANIYFKNKKGFTEIPALSLGVSGQRGDFFFLKNAIVEILKYLNIEEAKISPVSYKNFTNALAVTVKGEDVGFLGKLDDQERKRLDLKEDVLFAQLNLLALAQARQKKRYSFFSPYPAIWRDISLFLKREIKFSDLEKIIKAEAKHLSDLQIIDVYAGKDVPEGLTAFTLRVFYQSKDKTLSSQEVDFFHNNIREKLTAQAGITVR